MYATSTYGSAGLFSRDDLRNWQSTNDYDARDWMTHEDQPFIGRSRNDYMSEIDGKGKDKKKQMIPSQAGNRRDEMVGSKAILKSAMSQPLPYSNPRRDEMVTAGRVKPVYTERKVDEHGYHQEIRRQRKSSGEVVMKQNRRRSVSPQMVSKNYVSKQFSSPANHYYTSSHGNNHLTKDPEHTKTGAATPPRPRKHFKVKNDMSNHDNRCKTYELEPKWPHSRVHHVSLASHGLFYTGLEDIVQCFDCHVKIFDWSSRDDPLRRHFKDSPNCQFLRREYHDDIEEVCCEDFSFFADFDNRLKSFRDWPIPRQVDVRLLAESGWYYTGNDVSTQCFTCGCEYNEWKKGDDPVLKHKQLSNKCSFLWKLDDRKPTVQQLQSPSSLLAIDFSSVQSRIDSFKLLPKDFPTTKEEFAEAGFCLLAANPIIIKCWSCEFVTEWSKCDNDPLEFHRNNNPYSCRYLMEVDSTASKYKESACKEISSKSKQTSSGSHKKLLESLPAHRHSSYQKPFYASLPTTSSTSSTSFITEDKLCVVCLDNIKEYAIVPCGHLCVCRTCVHKLTHCPLCREVKGGILRIYNS